MPVAKSYQNLKIVSDVFTSSGRQYVNVETKTGAVKTVRWYSESAYAKMYNEPIPVVNEVSQKDALGFKDGNITIFKGETYPHLEWFKQSPTRYCNWWGWYLPAGMSIPEDLPIDLTPISLSWETVGMDNGNLKSDKDIESAISNLLYEKGESRFVGEVGDRLTLEVEIKRVIELDSSYADGGISNMHIMEDGQKNVYVWTTASKKWAAGAIKNIRGTIKDHRTYKNIKQTILKNCREIQL